MTVKELIDDLSPRKQMQFEPVKDDDGDELSDLLRNDPQTHDNVWDLQEGIDGDKLDEFWTDALHELGPLETEQDDQA